MQASLSNVVQGYSFQPTHATGCSLDFECMVGARASKNLCISCSLCGRIYAWNLPIELPLKFHMATQHSKFYNTGLFVDYARILEENLMSHELSQHMHQS